MDRSDQIDGFLYWVASYELLYGVEDNLSINLSVLIHRQAVVNEFNGIMNQANDDDDSYVSCDTLLDDFLCDGFSHLAPTIDMTDPTESICIYCGLFLTSDVEGEECKCHECDEFYVPVEMLFVDDDEATTTL